MFSQILTFVLYIFMYFIYKVKYNKTSILILFEFLFLNFNNK